MKRFILFLIFFCSYFIQAQNLNPGDGVRIIFFNTPDNITGDYYIQKDGTIRLPFLHEINAINRDMDSVRNEIYRKYNKLYKNPELTVLPLYKINVLGEVRTPGFYYVTGVEKLSDIIAKAGGLTTDADINDIYITRQNEEINIDGEEIIQNGDKLKDIGLQSGDRIYISRKWWVSARNSAIIVSAVAAVATIVAVIINNRR